MKNKTVKDLLFKKENKISSEEQIKRMQDLNDELLYILNHYFLQEKKEDAYNLLAQSLYLYFQNNPDANPMEIYKIPNFAIMEEMFGFFINSLLEDDSNSQSSVIFKSFIMPLIEWNSFSGKNQWEQIEQNKYFLKLSDHIQICVDLSIKDKAFIEIIDHENRLSSFEEYLTTELESGHNLNYYIQSAYTALDELFENFVNFQIKKYKDILNFSFEINSSDEFINPFFDFDKIEKLIPEDNKSSVMTLSKNGINIMFFLEEVKLQYPNGDVKYETELYNIVNVNFNIEGTLTEYFEKNFALKDKKHFAFFVLNINRIISAQMESYLLEALDNPSSFEVNFTNEEL